jgi:hypothetical protein
MTHEWKNDRYEGALAESIEIDVFYDDSEGLRRGAHSTADVLVNSFNVNEGTRNLLADAAINAKRVEELEAEMIVQKEQNMTLRRYYEGNLDLVRDNERLKSEYAYLESFLKDGKMYCQNCPQTQGRNMLHWSEWEGDVSETLTLEVPSKDYDRLTRAASELAALKAKYTPRPMSEGDING